MCLKTAAKVAHSVDPDQMLKSLVSDLGLHCLPVLGITQFQGEPQKFCIPTKMYRLYKRERPMGHKAHLS